MWEEPGLYDKCVAGVLVFAKAELAKTFGISNPDEEELRGVCGGVMMGIQQRGSARFDQQSHELTGRQAASAYAFSDRRKR